MALNYRLLDGSEADGGVASKRQWLQPKVVGVVAVLGVVCLSSLLMMPEAAEPKASSVAFLGQDEKAATVAIVKAGIAAWQQGAFNGKDALENARKWVSSDFFVDGSGPNNPGFKVYHGAEGLVEWAAFNVKVFNFTYFTGNVTAGDAPGQALWAYSIGVAAPSGKVFNLKGVDDFRINSVGLMTSCTVYWDVKTLNEYLAECSNSASAISIVKSSAEAWKKGEFSGPHAMATAEKFCTEDIVFDTSGPNHPAFKVYKGRQGLLDWIAVFAKIANITAVSGSFFEGSAPDKVLWAYSETWSSPTGKLFPFSGYDDFTVTDGKISSVIIYWDVKTVNEYLAETKV